jgi:4-hydroxy-tetrahydrodipicolinate synthase
MAEMCAAAISGDQALANQLNDELMPLHNSLFLEANPIPVKWALQQMNRISEGIRLPLTPLSAEAQPPLREAMCSLQLV